MDFDFTKVSFDADLAEIEDADELRGIVREFEKAQDANISEFQEAKDTLNNLEGRVGEAKEFKADLAEQLGEVSPLSEEEAMSYDMSRIRELITEFSDPATGDVVEGDEGGEGDFGDMGSRGNTDGDEDSSFAADTIEGIDGLNI
jgi:hypothetical protein